MIQRERRVPFSAMWILGITLFIIFPQYIYVLDNVNIVNAMALLLLAFYIICEHRIRLMNLSGKVFLIWLFYIICAVQHLITDSVIKFITYALSFIILPYITVTYIDNEHKFYNAIDMFINGGFVLSILGLAEAYVGSSFLQLLAPDSMEVFNLTRYGLHRIMGSFGQPIGYGLFQVVVVTLILYRLSTVGRRRIFLIIAYIFCSLNVFLTISRIPILAWVLIHILLVTQLSQKKRGQYVVFGILGVIAACFVISIFGIEIPFVDDLVQTAFLLLSGDSSSTNEIGVGNRLDLWKWVSESMGNSWLWGHGASNPFAYEVYEWQTKTSIENQYLNVMYYNGLIGLATLLISYITTLRVVRISGQKFLRWNTERSLSFNKISWFLLIVYYICGLGVQESDMSRMYIFYVTLIIVYNRINNRRCEICK